VHSPVTSAPTSARHSATKVRQLIASGIGVTGGGGGDGGEGGGGG